MKKLLCAVCAMAAASAVFGADTEWQVGSGSWGESGSWDKGVPVGGDTAIFDSAGAKTVFLNGSRAAHISVRTNAADGVTFLGGNADSTLTLGSLTVVPDAGPVVIGSHTEGQRVNVALSGSPTWNNTTTNAVVIKNAVSGAGALTLGSTGSGGFRFDSPNTYAGATTVQTPRYQLDANATPGAGNVTVNRNGANLVVNDFPRVFPHLFATASGLEHNTGFVFAGDALVTLTGANNNGVAITSNNNSDRRHYTVNGTAPLRLTGDFVVVNNSSGLQYAGDWKLGSSANLIFEGDVKSFNNQAFFDAGSGSGLEITFQGMGANVSFLGNKRFMPSSTRVNSVYITTGGYNVLSLLGDGPAGTVVYPLGPGLFNNQNSREYYLKPLTGGQKLPNNFHHQQWEGFLLGFAGEHDLTLAGRLSGANGTTRIPNISSACLTFDGELYTNGGTLNLSGFGSWKLGTNLVLNIGGSLIKAGPGAFIIAGRVPVAAKDATFNGGGLVLDYGAWNTNKFYQAAANTCNLYGVDVEFRGGTYVQPVNYIALQSGATRVRRTSGSATLALGGWGRGNGATLDAQPGIVTCASAAANVSLSHATINGADFGMFDNAGGLVAFTGGVPFPAPNLADVSHTGSHTLSTSANTVIKTLKINGGGSLTVPTGRQFHIRDRGILFVGSGNFIIDGDGDIIVDNNYTGREEPIYLHHYGDGVLEISARIINSYNGGALVKTGPGRAVLSHPANTYVNPTYINAGVLEVSADGNLGTGGVTINGGALHLPVGFASTRGITFGCNGGTVRVDSGLFTVNAIGGSSCVFEKTGAGAMLISNASGYTGATVVRGGRLVLGNNTSLGTPPSATLGSANSSRAEAPVTVAGGALDIAGCDVGIGNFYLKGGALDDSVGTGTFGAFAFNVEDGVINASLADILVSGLSGLQPVNLYKTTAGTVTLNGANSYTGNTFVDAGTLVVNGVVSGAVNVENAMLGGSGEIKRTVNVVGGTFAPVDTMTLGRHLSLDGAMLKATVTNAGASQILFTHPEARVVLNNAELDITVSGANAAKKFTLAKNPVSVEGEFNGLPEGAKFVRNDRRFSITYQGGAGHDIVIDCIQTGTLLFLK